MTDKQPEALRLADELERLPTVVWPQAAAELRKLDGLVNALMEANSRHMARITALETANKELLEALKSCIEYGSMTGDDWVADKARAAIAKHGGEA